MKETTFVSEALEMLVPPFASEASAWDDVVRRADGAYARRRRPYRPVAVVAVVLALLVGSAFAGERVVGLFSDDGPAVDVNELSERDRQTLRRLGRGAPVRSIEAIGNDGRRAYYKVEFENGIGCLLSGSPQGENRLGGGSCGPGLFAATQAHPLLPTPKRPITADVPVEASVDDPVPRIWRVTGLAGQGVARVGLVDAHGEVHSVPVEGRVYQLADLPHRPWSALVALDSEGNEVYRERLRLLEGPVRRARSDRSTGEPGGTGTRGR